MGIDWVAFKDWLLLGLLGAIGSVVLVILLKIFATLKLLSRQVEHLITESGWYKEMVDDHGEQLEVLHKKTGSHDTRIAVVETRLKIH